MVNRDQPQIAALNTENAQTSFLWFAVDVVMVFSYFFPFFAHSKTYHHHCVHTILANGEPIVTNERAPDITSTRTST